MFQAALDAPIALDGQLIAPKGALVTGHVVAAKSAMPAAEPGFLRITLSTLEIRGKPRPLESSSLFVKGRSPVAHRLAATHPGVADVGLNYDVTLTSRRSLTFRLAQALDIEQ
jgi:hypothetical protein